MPEPNAEENAEEAEPQPASRAPAASPQPQIDMEELAMKVFEIFRRELRLENERTGR